MQGPKYLQFRALYHISVTLTFLLVPEGLVTGCEAGLRCPSSGIYCVSLSLSAGRTASKYWCSLDTIIKTDQTCKTTSIY